MSARKPPTVSDRVYQFRIFIQVVDAGNFVGAARALRIPPATVSAAIRMLEGELGVRLLHRTTRQVGLTEDGQRVLPMARKVANDLDDIYHLLKSDEHVVKGRLHVGVPSRIASRLMAPALPALLQRHPGLDLTVSSCEWPLDLIKEGVDCVIRIGDPIDDAVVYKPLDLLDMVSCASPGYVAANGVPKHPDDLARHWAVGCSQSIDAQPTPWSYTDRSGAARSAPVRHRATVNNMDSRLAFCLAGIGLIQAPRLDVQHLLTNGELVEVLPDWPAAPMPIAALYLRRHQRSRRLVAFIDWFQALLDRSVA